MNQRVLTTKGGKKGNATNGERNAREAGTENNEHDLGLQQREKRIGMSFQNDDMIRTWAVVGNPG